MIVDFEDRDSRKAGQSKSRRPPSSDHTELQSTKIHDLRNVMALELSHVSLTPYLTIYHSMSI